MDDDPLLTPKQVADRLQLNERTIRRWISSGKLRGVWLGNDRSGWRIRNSEIGRILLPERPADQPRQPRLPMEAKREPKKLAA